MPPSGDNRLPYLYVKNGREEQLRQLIKDHFADDFDILPSEQAIRGGLLGLPPFYPPSAERIGELLLLPRGLSYLWWGEKADPLLGRHGGLSRTEMLVPLLAIEG